jgi:carbon storage regulator
MFHERKLIMLVLSRKVGQSIQIGDEIRVTVTQVRGGRIRIGIDAPEAVSIRRSELNLREPASKSRHVTATELKLRAMPSFPVSS